MKNNMIIHLQIWDTPKRKEAKNVDNGLQH